MSLPSLEAAQQHLRLRSVVFLFSGLTLLLTYPLPLHMASTVLNDNPDTHLFLWTLGWDVHALTTQPFSIFDANIYYPQRLTLAYSENLIGSAFFAAPVLVAHRQHRAGTERRDAALLRPVRTRRVCAGTPAWTQHGERDSVRAGLRVFTGAVLPDHADPSRRRCSGCRSRSPICTRISITVARETRGSRSPSSRLQALTSGHGAVFATLAVAALLVFRLATGRFDPRSRDRVRRRGGRRAPAPAADRPRLPSLPRGGERARTAALAREFRSGAGELPRVTHLAPQFRAVALPGNTGQRAGKRVPVSGLCAARSSRPSRFSQAEGIVGTSERSSSTRCLRFCACGCRPAPRSSFGHG